METLIEYEYSEDIPLKGEGKYICYNVEMGGFISEIICRGYDITRVSLSINDKLLGFFYPKNNCVKIKLSPKSWGNTTAYFMLVYGDPHDSYNIFPKDTYVCLDKYNTLKLGIDFSQYVYHPNINFTYLCSNVEYQLGDMKYLRFFGTNFPPIEKKSGSLTKSVR